VLQEQFLQIIESFVVTEPHVDKHKTRITHDVRLSWNNYVYYTGQFCRCDTVVHIGSVERFQQSNANNRDS